MSDIPTRVASLNDLDAIAPLFDAYRQFYEQPADLESVRKVIESLGYADVPVQNFGTSRDVLIRMPAT